MNQEFALSILKSGKNVFLTGSAGTGKTYVLNEYIKYLRERKVAVAITASTGIAATHIGGIQYIRLVELELKIASNMPTYTG